MMLSSADQMKSEYQENMGVGLGSAYYSIVGKVVSVHEKWAAYTALLELINLVWRF